MNPPKLSSQRIWIPFLISTGCVALMVFTGCRTPAPPPLSTFDFNALLDLESPRMGTLTYTEDIQPIFDARCASCHSCFDAPAQLKLTSAEGLIRGGSKQRVYDLARLSPEMPTRLGEDASTEAQWREKGFFTVLPDPAATTPEERLDSSVLYQMLAMSRLRQLPEGGLLDAIVRDSHDIPMAPTIAEFPDYIQKFPHAGMPFYTYGLEEDEFETIALWIADGAKIEKKDLSPSPKEQQEIEKWENLLNQPSHKDQLIARYIFEHLFSAHLHFKNLPDSKFFKVVRSKTPPGEAVDPIYTRRPNDAPGVERVYYRIVKYGAEIMRKNHLPYELNDDRISYWQEIFWQSEWDVESLPGYTPHLAQRPFDVYKAMPEHSRYAFMLDSSFYFVQSFIRGPVCRGQVALNGIWDHFFLYFLDPQSDPATTNDAFMIEAKPNLALPLGFTGKKDTVGYGSILDRAHVFHTQQNKAFLTQDQTRDGFGIEDIWAGRKQDDAPFLTVFRHFDTASVEKGFIGETPPHGWFVDYTLFERIYYLLVVNYDVFGTLGHQLATRLYFDYLRFEGECNYLRLFPEKDREEMFNQWYNGISKRMREKHYAPPLLKGGNTIAYNADSDLRDQLRKQVIANERENPGGNEIVLMREVYKELPQETAPFVQYFPEVTFVRIQNEKNEDTVMTILRNKAFKNVSGLLDEKDRRIPEQDSLLLVEGLIGDYPNMMIHLHVNELPAFKQAVNSATSKDDMVALLLKFGVLRTSRDFWPTLDWFTAWQQQQDPIQAGRFDLKHYFLTKILMLAEADIVK
ncbi:fatty acid cis/trans isomerase [Kiritimatiellaeota bacterium B1221]|nr:fatty acid cis/trans isomerase [Kiritimatiellaeota bacterium B1221]